MVRYLGRRPLSNHHSSTLRSHSRASPLEERILFRSHRCIASANHPDERAGSRYVWLLFSGTLKHLSQGCQQRHQWPERGDPCLFAGLVIKRRPDVDLYRFDGPWINRFCSFSKYEFQSDQVNNRGVFWEWFLHSLMACVEALTAHSGY